MIENLKNFPALLYSSWLDIPRSGPPVSKWTFNRLGTMKVFITHRAEILFGEEILFRGERVFRGRNSFWDRKTFESP